MRIDSYRCRLLGLLVRIAGVAGAVASSPARADQDSDVAGAQLLATESDRCGRHDVRVTSGHHLSGPTALVHTNDNATFEVSSPEIRWACEEGSSKSEEHTRCPAGTNLIRVRRGNDRVVSTQCFKTSAHVAPPTPMPAPGIALQSGDLAGAQLLSTETERCGRKAVLVTRGQKLSGPELLESQNAESIWGVLSPEIQWSCLDPGQQPSDERTRCPQGTNVVRVRRGQDRLVSFQCLKLPPHAIEASVNDYRAKRGFSFVNDIANRVGSYTFDDLTELYGKCETHLVPGCAIPDPLAYVYLGIINGTIPASGGQCYGFSIASLKIASGDTPASFFPSFDGVSEKTHVPSTDVWHLIGPSLSDKSQPNVSPNLTHFIHQQHVLQTSIEALGEQLKAFVTNKSPADIEAEAKRAKAAGGGMVTMFDYGSADGHAMVVYDVLPIAGGFSIETYNNNVPWKPTEDRTTALARSRISVFNDGTYKFDEQDKNKFKGAINPAQLMIWPFSTFKGQNHMPTSLAGALRVFMGGIVPENNAAPAAKLTQITDATGHTMFRADGSLNTDAATRIPNAMPFIVGAKGTGAHLVVADGSVKLTHTFRGTAQGSYSARFVGPGYGAELEGMPSQSGETDSLTLDAKAASAELSTAASQKAFRLKLHAKAVDGSVRTAVIKGTASSGGAVRFAFDATRDALVYTHAGAPATIALELSASHARGATTSAHAPISVKAGDTVTIMPNWSQLQTQGAFRLRGANGAESTHPLR